MSSRLAVDRWGRQVVVVTSSTDGLPIGHVFVVIDWKGFFTPPGRRPTPAEMQRARLPYDPTSAKRRRAQLAETPDHQLDDQAAIEAAYAEQRNAPVDLVNVAA
jgi:hypothetical protein